MNIRKFQKLEVPQKVGYLWLPNLIDQKDAFAFAFYLLFFQCHARELALAEIVSGFARFRAYACVQEIWNFPAHSRVDTKLRVIIQIQPEPNEKCLALPISVLPEYC